MLQFSDLPEKWAALIKTASTIKYDIVPIQAHQIDLISKRITFFNQLSKHFRQEFNNKSVRIRCLITTYTVFTYTHLSVQFFLIPCTNVYGLLDDCNLKIKYLEHQLQNLIESALIFGLPTPSKSELESCRSEIKLIKVFSIRYKTNTLQCRFSVKITE